MQINQRRNTTQEGITAQQQRLSERLRRQYLAGSQDPFKLLFSGADPNIIQRDLFYQGYLARAQAEALKTLRVNLNELEQISEQIRQRDAELSRIAHERQNQRASLVQEQRKRRDLLTSISGKLRVQRREAGVLERDEKRLARVVEELAKVIERQAREREQAQRREQERAKTATREKTPSTPERPTPAARPNASAELSADAGAYGSFSGGFAKLKGRLRLPLRGDLIARFGNSRQDGGPNWKGVFIRAAQGTEVKSVAPGRIVFAEWLRGFGNLLIVDHGDQYLSIYGNNESLYKQPGDTVQTGETLATVGNTGGNAETGLYFELRFAGRPFDPLSWAVLR